MNPSNNPHRARWAVRWAVLCAVCCVVPCVALPAPAAADSPPISIGVRVGGVLTEDRGLDPLSHEDLTFQGGLYAEVEAWSPTGPDHLSVGFEWSNRVHSALLFNTFDTTTRSDYLLATLTYRYDLLPSLGPYVRTAAGFGLHELDLSDYSADDLAFGGYSSLGAEVIVPYSFWSDTATTTVGARLDLGYTYSASPHFTATRDTNPPEDAPEIPLSGVDLGHMPTHGFNVSFDLFVRF